MICAECGDGIDAEMLHWALARCGEDADVDEIYRFCSTACLYDWTDRANDEIG